MKCQLLFFHNLPLLRSIDLSFSYATVCFSNTCLCEKLTIEKVYVVTCKSNGISGLVSSFNAQAPLTTGNGAGIRTIYNKYQLLISTFMNICRTLGV
jgi:hypothetical protein